MPVVVAFGLCPLRHHEPSWNPEPFEQDNAPVAQPAPYAQINSFSSNVTVALTGVSADGVVGDLMPESR
jgi:hypothetical protein